MAWILDHVLMPLLNLLYVPCDWILGWTSIFPPVVSITIVGLVSGLAIILVQKYGSNQKLLADCKADLKLLKQRARAAKAASDADGLRRARALSSRIGGKYMGAALKPALWTVPIIGVIGLWTGSRLGFLPIRPGDDVAMTAHFEDGAKGFAHVVPGEAFKAAGPLVAPVEIPQEATGLVGKQARWKLKAATEGTSMLRIRFADRTYEVPIPVAKSGGRPPEPVTTFAEATPTQDQLQAVEIQLAPSLPAAWWNLMLQWGGLYLIVAVGSALALRFILKVQ